MFDSSVLCQESPPLLPTVPPPPVPQRHDNLDAGELESGAATTARQHDDSAQPRARPRGGGARSGARPRQICIYGEPRRGICNGYTESTRRRRWSGTATAAAGRGVEPGPARLGDHSAVPGPRRRHGGTNRHDTTRCACRIVPYLGVPCLAEPVPVPCRGARLATYTARSSHPLGPICKYMGSLGGRDANCHEGGRE